MRHKFDGAETVRLIGQEAITNVHLVPTQFKRMLDCSDAERAALDTSTLHAVWHGAAPCPPVVEGRHDRLVRALRVHEYYGSTEGAFISTIRADDWLRKGGSVGKPLEIIDVLVVDDDGNQVPQLARRARSTSGTRWEPTSSTTTHPDKTAEAHLEPGVFTTGDVGFIDDEGYLWLSDRKIDMIISRRGQHLSGRDRGRHRRTPRRGRCGGDRRPQRRVR